MINSDGDRILQLLFHAKNQKAIHERLLDLAKKRKIKILYIPESEEGVTGYAFINLIAIRKGLLLIEEIAVLAHEIGHWLDRQQLPDYHEKLYSACAQDCYYPEPGEKSFLHDDNLENRAWKRAERIIRVILWRDR